MTNSSSCSVSHDLIGSMGCLSEQRTSCSAIQKSVRDCFVTESCMPPYTVRRKANSEQPPGLRRLYDKSCYLVGTAVIVCGRPPRLLALECGKRGQCVWPTRCVRVWATCGRDSQPWSLPAAEPSYTFRYYINYKHQHSCSNRLTNIWHIWIGPCSLNHLILPPNTGQSAFFNEYKRLFVICL